MGLIGTVVISALTMVRCRSRWQFIAIAAWKLNLSLCLSFVTLHSAFTAKNADDRYHHPYDFRHPDDPHDSNGRVYFWLLLYIPGVCAGMAGLFSLVAETIHDNHKVMIVTAVFGSIALTGALVYGGVFGLLSQGGMIGKIFASGGSILVMALAGLGVLGVFYSDWILAAIAENMSGTPSSDIEALYWSYFVFKRLPFFST